MVEKELYDTLFMVPTEFIQQEYGYLSRQEFSEQLKQGAFIGRYDKEGKFTIDFSLTEQYKKTIPDIAEALACSSRDKKHRKYKIATIEKGSLNIHFEWQLEQFFNIKQIKFSFGKLAKCAIGADVILLDMHGPAYEVIAPLTLDAIMQNMKFGALRQIASSLKQRQKKCINPDYKQLSTLTSSLSIFGHICRTCPSLCSMKISDLGKNLHGS